MHTIDPIGSEFAHRSWISILWFYPLSQSFRNSSEFHSNVVLYVFHVLLRDPVMAMKCGRSAGVINQWFWCMCLTQTFKLHSQVPKKFERTCVILLYVGIYFICMAGRVYKCRAAFCLLSQNVTWEFTVRLVFGDDAHQRCHPVHMSGTSTNVTELEFGRFLSRIVKFHRLH